MANFQDQDGETDFFDDTPVGLGGPVTLWVDHSTPGIFLGLGGVPPDPVDPVDPPGPPTGYRMPLRMRLHAVLFWGVVLLTQLVPT